MVGIDIQPVDEVETSLSIFGDRYRRLLFTNDELEHCGNDSRTAPKLAARFAAKEAVLKVLEIGGDVPSWRSIEVKDRVGERREIVLHNAAARLAQSQGIKSLTVSFSHAGGVAAAVVIATRQFEYEESRL